MTSLRDAMSQFDLANQADGFALTTQDWYRYILTESPHGLLAWLLGHGVRTVEAVTAVILREYVVWLRARRHLRTDKPLTEDTINDYRRVMHRFFTWSALEYEIPNPASKLKYPKPKPHQAPRSITPENFMKMFNWCKDTVQGVRNRAILAFLLDTGVRAAGICGLKLEDVNLKERYATVTEKGNKSRIVLFSDKTRELLEAWYRVREPVAPVFYNLLIREPLTVNGLRHLLRRIADAAGVVGRVNPHSFRHGFSILCIKAGMDLRTLQILLGHERFATTAEMYVLFSNREVFERYDQFSPIRQLLAA